MPGSSIVSKLMKIEILLGGIANLRKIEHSLMASLFHDGGPYYIKNSRLIWRANQ